jgi:hypothetical protein
MMPFHSLFPEVAQREVRYVNIGPSPEPSSEADVPPDEYVFFEFYCAKPDCDCRRVFLQVVRKGDPNRILASIEYGWEKESFYRKNFWSEEDARQTVRGTLDPINEQSEIAEYLLDVFRQVVLDVPYSLRLRRHYRMFKEELARHPEKLKTEPGKAK